MYTQATYNNILSFDHIEPVLSKKEGGKFMDTLSDKLLVQAYKDAKRNNLNPEFIRILEEEIHHRVLRKVLSNSQGRDMLFDEESLMEIQ